VPVSTSRANDPAAEWVHVRDLKPWGRNPKKHDGPAFDAFVRSVESVGLAGALTVRASDGRLVAGHRRRLAVQAILARNPEWRCDAAAPGPGFVRVVRRDLNDDASTALALADNHRDLQGMDDADALLAILGDFRQRDEDALAAIGYADAAIDRMIEAASPQFGPSEGDPSRLDQHGQSICKTCHRPL